MWDDENYYLIAYDAVDDKIKHYRVDKMRNIELTEAKRVGRDHFREFDVARYARMNFGMFGGEEVRVRLRFRNELVGVLLDRFGKDIPIKSTADEGWSETSVDVALSDQFLGWIVALGEGVRITAPEDVVALPFPLGEEVGAVCQTTLSGDVVRKVMEALRARHPGLVTSATAEVCTATRDRQEAVRRFVASGGDGVLVLGSASSSNTRRLAEIASESGAKTWRAVDAAEVSAIDFAGVRRLGVTSGASTPEEVFADVIESLKE